MSLTPAQLLDSAPIHSITATAIILGCRRRNGDPDRRVVHQLIRSGAIRLVDPDQPIQRWSVSSTEIRRYIEHGARKGADIVPIRSAS